MLFLKENINRFKRNKLFVIFAFSQLLSFFGDAFTFIALTALLLKITQSGILASFNLICTPIASIFLSPLAGSLSDRFNEKHLLILINLLKAFVTLLFLANYNLPILLILMLFLAAFEIVANPLRRKLMAKLLSNSDFLLGNSLLTGIMGTAFIFGPLICGLVIDLEGIDLAFISTSLLYFLAALTTLFIKSRDKIYQRARRKSNLVKDVYSDFRTARQYFNSQSYIKNVIMVTTIIGSLVASINVAFYSFAFDILKVSNSTWGIMMSLFYGTNLMAMFTSIYLQKIIKKIDFLFLAILFILTSGIWFAYSGIRNLPLVLFLQIIEGLLLTMATIYLNTKLQLVTREDFLGRAIGLSDMLSNLGKLIAISLTYLLVGIYSVKTIFIINCFSLLAFTLLIILRGKR